MSPADEATVEPVGREFTRREPRWFLPNAPLDEELAKADRALFEAWLCAEVSRLSGDTADLETLPKALHVIREVNRRITGRPLLNRPSADSVSEREFFERCYARLLFGYTNCEGLAYLVYRLCSALGLDVTIIETETEFRHTLVVLKDGGGWTVLDPYADFHHYYVSGFPIAEVLGEPSLASLPPFPDTPEYDSFGFPHGAVIEHGLFPGAGVRVSRQVRLRFESPSLPNLREVAATLAARAEEDLGFFSRFLELRHEHLWERPPKPGAYATLAAEHRLGGFTGTLLATLDAANS